MRLRGTRTPLSGPPLWHRLPGLRWLAAFLAAFLGAALRRAIKLDPQTLRTVLGTMHFAFGTASLIWPQAFVNNPAYFGLLKLGPPIVWAYGSLTLSVILLLSSPLGRWSRLLALLSGASFTALATTISLTNGPNMGTLIYAFLGLFSFWSFVLGQVLVVAVPVRAAATPPCPPDQGEVGGGP